jgi:hypothetical protein
MIAPALRFVLARRLRRRIERTAQRPVLAAVVLIYLIVMANWWFSGGFAADSTPGDRAQFLVAMVGFALLLSALNGLGEARPRLGPAEMSFVLPGPFPHRHVLVYELANAYGEMVVATFTYGAFVGLARTPNPLGAAAGCLLCLLLSVHVGRIVQRGSASLGSTISRRVRVGARIGIVVVVCAGLAAILAAMSGNPRLIGAMRSLIESDAVRLLLWPAHAVGRLALSTSASEVATLLGLQMLLLGLSFGVLLLFPPAYEHAEVDSQRRRLRAAAPSSIARAAAWRGSGAIAWLNVLGLRRSLRSVFGVAVAAGFLVVMMRLSHHAMSTGIPREIPFLVALPLFAHLPIGFRGHVPHLPTLKTLPLRPVALALAQVVVPVLVITALQVLVLCVFVVIGELTTTWLLVGLAAYPLVNVAVLVVTEIVQFGRERTEATVLTALLQMFYMVLVFIPPAVVGVIAFRLARSIPLVLLAAALTMVVTDALLLRALGRRFSRWEP